MRVVPLHNDTISGYDLRAGDAKGFSKLYDSLYLAVFQFAKKMVGDRGQAEDITAESFIKLWNYAQGAEVRDARSFVLIAAKNACLDFLRSEKLHQRKEAEIKWLAEQDSRTEFVNAEIRAEVLLYIQAEIEKLPETTKKIFKLSFIEGLKTAEIVKLLGLSEQTIYNHKNIALKTLRFALKDKPLPLGLLIFLQVFK